MPISQVNDTIRKKTNKQKTKSYWSLFFVHFLVARLYYIDCHYYFLKSTCVQHMYFFEWDNLFRFQACWWGFRPFYALGTWGSQFSLNLYNYNIYIYNHQHQNNQGVFSKYLEISHRWRCIHYTTPNPSESHFPVSEFLEQISPIFPSNIS